MLEVIQRTLEDGLETHPCMILTEMYFPILSMLYAFILLLIIITLYFRQAESLLKPSEIKYKTKFGNLFLKSAYELGYTSDGKSHCYKIIYFHLEHCIGLNNFRVLSSSNY